MVTVAADGATKPPEGAEPMPEALDEEARPG